MEYCDIILDKAAKETDSTKRCALVAAFMVSRFRSNTVRVQKPFNPLLAETYELVTKNYRFFIE